MAPFDRRTFLQIAGAQAGILATTRNTTALTDRTWEEPPQIQTLGGANSDIIVIGAGAFGGWTALHLRELGIPVTLVDAHGPGNSRASSGGESRLLRFIRPGPGREVYTPFVLKSIERWKALQKEWMRPLFIQTGRLEMYREWTAVARAEKVQHEKYQLECEELDHDELARRYPQMNPDGIAIGLLKPGLGFVKAREGCQAVARVFQKRGGRVITGRVDLGKRVGGRLHDVRLPSGEALSAHTFVFALGPWLPKIFPEVMKNKLNTPLSTILWFATPPGDDRFTYPNFPCFRDNEGVYGHCAYPDDYRGFKVSVPGGGPGGGPQDPDTVERFPPEERVARTRAYVAQRFPALKDQPILFFYSGCLENTIDGHFIVARHPEMANVWLAGGGSGFGYMNGPAIGEYIANRVAGREQSPELEKIFSIKAEIF